MAIKESTSAVLARIDEKVSNFEGDLRDIKESNAEMHAKLYGNGTPGIATEVRDLKRILYGDDAAREPGMLAELRATRDQLTTISKQISVIWTALKRSAKVAGIVGVALLTAAATNLVETIFEEPQPDRTEEAVTCEVSYSSTPTPTLPPPVTRTPSPAPTKTAAPQSIPESGIGYPTEQELDALSALCWVECRGMLDAKPACCTSVVDTVYTRIGAKSMTDGTVIGTIRYACGPDTLACQFPAYVTRGCNGIRSACPFDDPKTLVYFKDVLRLYFAGKLHPECAGYLFYGLKPFDTPDCRITAANGQWVNFHNGIND